LAALRGLPYAGGLLEFSPFFSLSMKIRRAILFLFGLAVALNGCRPAAQNRPEFGLDSQMTPQATALRVTSSSPNPSVTPTPPLTASPTPSLTATQARITPTPTPSQSLLTLDPIQIRSPGVNSIVTSPLAVLAQLSFDGSVNSIRIELHAQDGALLVRKVIEPARLGLPGKDLVESMAYEIDLKPVNGWIVIGMDEAPDYPVAVNAVPIQLLPTGKAQITPPTWQAKTIDIQTPGAGVAISDGLIRIAGLTSLEAGQPLKIQLLAPGGKVIGQSLAVIGGNPTDEFKPFSANLSYAVETQTAARLVVFSELGQTGVVLHLASLPILVSP
jgi:hypothetical protein